MWYTTILVCETNGKQSIYSSHDSWTEANAMACRLDRECPELRAVVMSEAVAMSFGLVPCE